MRYFIELSYKGTAYNGWQRQTNAPSVQAEIERALSTLLREDIEIVGCGRTDTGVHAAHYVAHFDAKQIVDIHHLNCLLPNDIAIKKVYEVADYAHARFDAIEREYTYYISLGKNPFRREFTWKCYYKIDEQKLELAADKLLNYNDFTAFAKLHSGNKTNLCDLSFARWERVGDELVFTIRANRFLRNMVRAIVGTLVDVGRGKLSVEEFEQIIAAQKLTSKVSTAPAQGLFLTGIKYK